MKTEPNEPIVPLTLRQVGDNDFRPATPKEINEGIYLSQLSGLTKREHFAGLAMQGLMIHKATQITEDIVMMAVRTADALIEELNRTQD